MKFRLLLTLLLTTVFLQMANAAFEIQHLGTRAVGIGGICSIADENSMGLINNPLGGLSSSRFNIGATYQNLFSSWASINAFNASFRIKKGAFSCGYLELLQNELNYQEKIINLNYAVKFQRLSLGLGIQRAEMNHRYGGGIGSSLNLAMQIELNPKYKIGVLATSVNNKNTYETGNADKKPTVISLGNAIAITQDTELKLEIVDFSGIKLGIEKSIGSIAIRGGLNENRVPTFGFSMQKDKLHFEYGLLMNEGGNSSLLSIMVNI